MPHITITIPDRIRKDMNLIAELEEEERINWSAIAREAFEVKLDEINRKNAKSENLSDDDIDRYQWY